MPILECQSKKVIISPLIKFVSKTCLPDLLCIVLSHSSFFLISSLLISVCFFLFTTFFSKQPEELALTSDNSTFSIFASSIDGETFCLLIKSF